MSFAFDEPCPFCLIPMSFAYDTDEDGNLIKQKINGYVFCKITQNNHSHFSLLGAIDKTISDTISCARNISTYVYGQHYYFFNRDSNGNLFFYPDMVRIGNNPRTWEIKKLPILIKSMPDFMVVIQSLFFL